jgi:hypothetical protein
MPQVEVSDVGYAHRAILAQQRASFFASLFSSREQVRQRLLL